MFPPILYMDLLEYFDPPTNIPQKSFIQNNLINPNKRTPIEAITDKDKQKYLPANKLGL